MSNARRLHRDHQRAHRLGTPAPEGRVRRLWWRVRKWLGVS